MDMTLQTSMLTWQQIYMQLINNCMQVTASLTEINTSNQKMRMKIDEEIQKQKSLLNELKEQTQNDENVVQEPKQKGCSQKTIDQSFDKNKGEKKSRKKWKTEIYQCPYEDCERQYKSAVSMNLHIKINHNGGTKKEREAYAKQLLENENGICNPPTHRLNLPPNFLEQFRLNYEYCKKYNM